MPYVNSIVRDALARGEAKGLELGMQRGLEQGLEQGLERGLEQGIQIGQLEGRRAAMAELLALRFGRLPEAAKSRIEQATLDDLSRWMAKTIVAGKLDDVLGEG